MIDDRTLQLLEWQRVSEALAHRARTPYGAEKAARVRPLPPAQAAEVRRRVEAWRHLLEQGQHPPFGDIADVRSLLAGAKRGSTLDGQALLDVAANMELVSELGRTLSRPGVPESLAGDATDLPDFSAISQRIYRVIDTSGGIRDDASETLRNAVSEARSRSLELRTRAEELLENERYRNLLRDKFVTQREGRFVLPIRIEYSNTVKGIIHDASATGATVYLEPEELTHANNRLTEARALIRDEIARLLAEVTKAVAGVSDDLAAALEVVGRIESEVARARLAADWNAVEPVHSPQIDIRDALQPLLLLRRHEVMPIDIQHPGSGLGVILSGPNAGGKTAALKTLGLCIVLARAGCQVPAAKASFPLDWDVAVELGDPQNLGEDLSTFSGHLQRLVELDNAANEKTIILVDELLKGTDPADGAPMARAWLEDLVKRNVPIWVTTHYGSLKALPAVDERFTAARTAFEHGKPAYTIIYGEAGPSYAFETAERMGFAKRVLDKAKLYREGEITRAEQALAEIDTLRKQLAVERRETEISRKQQQVLRDRLEAELSLLQKEKKDLVRRAAESTLAQLDRAREAAREAERSVKKKKETGRKRRIELGKTRETIERTLSEMDVPGKIEIEHVKPGIEVYSRRFKRNGLVLRLPERGQVALQIGGMQVSVAVDDLAPAQAAPAPKQQAGAPRTPYFPAVPEKLDIRGERLDDALSRIDTWLDDAFRARQSGVLTVVHGVGSGVLRDGVRTFLREHPSGLSFYGGDEERGGPGVTYIELG